MEENFAFQIHAGVDTVHLGQEVTQKKSFLLLMKI
jgi:hypothetical protein